MFLMPFAEYLRPWKLWTLGCGLAILIVGAFTEDAPDWDVPISLIMGLSTYVFAPVSGKILFSPRRYRRYLWWAVFCAWLCADGVYAAYWSWRAPEVLAMMRSANFPASLCLYGLCACLWMHEGSLREIMRLRK